MKIKIIWLVVSGLMALSLVLVSCGTAVTEEEEEVVTEEEVPQYGGWVTFPAVAGEHFETPRDMHLLAAGGLVHQVLQLEN